MKMRTGPPLRTPKPPGPTRSLYQRGSDGVVRSAEAAERNKLYHSSRWRRLRRQFLSAHPYCCLCQAEGRVEPARVVDHALGHGPHWRQTFWDMRHWRALCRDHHNRISAAEGRERGRRGAGARVRGTMPSHRAGPRESQN